MIIDLKEYKKKKTSTYVQTTIKTLSPEEKELLLDRIYSLQKKVN